MPSFPSAVKVFTTKNPGDTIQSAHVDDLQDEVTAIEDGYLNGTARLNAAASTLASLSVTGGSTLASLSVTNSTITNLTITGTFSGFLSLPFCRLTHSTKQDIANATWTALNWDTDAVDNSSLHSTAVNSSRLNLTSSGSWLLGVNVNFSANSSGQRYLRFLLNDTTTIAVISSPAVGAGQVTGMAIQTLAYVNSTTQYAGISVFADPGSTMSVTGDTGLNSCVFWAQRVSV